MVPGSVEAIFPRNKMVTVHNPIIKGFNRFKRSSRTALGRRHGYWGSVVANGRSSLTRTQDDYARSNHSGIGDSSWVALSFFRNQ